jgi:hypothetical protein
MDFNHTIYKKLLTTLQSQGFSFYTVAAYAQAKAEVMAEVKVKVEGSSAQPEPQPKPFIILRHDVEAKYGNALKMAKVQNGLGINGTYYFRIYPHNGNGNEGVILEIAALGHEIGYHYDDLSECKGDYEKAIHRFQKNLEYLRQFGPVTSASMEGAPLSKFDNRDLWRKVEGESERRGEGVKGREREGERESRGDGEFHPLSPSLPLSLTPSPPRPAFHYTDFGIKTEPYFDIDFNEIFYLTDTGRRWDGWKVSLRDKIPGHQQRWIEEGLVFRSTNDIIKAAQEGRLPQKVMITVHPQRWNDALVPWVKELFLQKVKNVVKGLMVR